MKLEFVAFKLVLASLEVFMSGLEKEMGLSRGSNMLVSVFPFSVVKE